MKNKKLWIGLIFIIALVGVGYYFREDILSLISDRTGIAVSAQGLGVGQGPGAG